jgi:uncharacterized protein
VRRVLLVLAIACRGRSADPPVLVVRDAAPSVEAPPPCPGPASACSACEAGSAEACTSIAYQVTSDGERERYYRRGCELGDPDACQGVSAQLLGRDHAGFQAATGREAELRTARIAQQRARCAATPPDDKACIDAGIALAVGRGGPGEVAAGRTMLDAACTRGVIDGCDALSGLDDVPLPQRAKSARIACKNHHEAACGDLVGLFDHEPLDPSAGPFARDVLAERCKTDLGSCRFLAGMYWMGKGVPKNLAKARAMLDKACAADKDYCDDRDKLVAGKSFNDLGVPLPTLDLSHLTKP